MKPQINTTTWDKELLNLGLSNELFFDDASYMDTDLYEVEGSEVFFNEMSFTDFAEIEREESPLYYKSVPLENTGTSLPPLGA